MSQSWKKASNELVRTLEQVLLLFSFKIAKTRFRKNTALTTPFTNKSDNRACFKVPHNLSHRLAVQVRTTSRRQSEKPRGTRGISNVCHECHFRRTAAFFTSAVQCPSRLRSTAIVGIPTVPREGEQELLDSLIGRNTLEGDAASGGHVLGGHLCLLQGGV